MSLYFGDGTAFASGLCSYSNQPATSGEGLTRLFMRVEVEDWPTLAIVDTGGGKTTLTDELRRRDPGARGAGTGGTRRSGTRSATGRRSARRQCGRSTSGPGRRAACSLLTGPVRDLTEER